MTDSSSHNAAGSVRTNNIEIENHTSSRRDMVRASIIEIVFIYLYSNVIDFICQLTKDPKSEQMVSKRTKLHFSKLELPLMYSLVEHRRA